MKWEKGVKPAKKPYTHNSKEIFSHFCILNREERDPPNKRRNDRRLTGLSRLIKWMTSVVSNAKWRWWVNKFSYQRERLSINPLR